MCMTCVLPTLRQCECDSVIVRETETVRVTASVADSDQVGAIDVEQSENVS